MDKEKNGTQLISWTEKSDVNGRLKDHGSNNLEKNIVGNLMRADGLMKEVNEGKLRARGPGQVECIY